MIFSIFFNLLFATLISINIKDKKTQIGYSLLAAFFSSLINYFINLLISSDALEMSSARFIGGLFGGFIVNSIFIIFAMLLYRKPE